VLETKNPKTGELYQLSDLNVMKMSDLGTGALEDGVFVQSDWIEDEDNQDIAKRFLKASFRGWVYCRDNPEDCLRIVLDNGPTLGEGHQRWMLNEINALIWPAPQGIGVMEPESWEVTKQIALDGKVIKKPASDDAYRTDIAEAAVDELKDDDVDVNGENWQKETVEVTEGGA
jgi:NitT/TauT family transport system substrate-binding protein